jgi:hypothetical protein
LVQVDTEEGIAIFVFRLVDNELAVDPYAQAVIGHADTDWQPILTRYMRMFITNSSDLGRTKGSAKRDLIVSNVYEIIIWILIVIIVS